MGSGVGADGGSGRVIPADQGFNADDVVSREVDDRLIEQVQFLAFDGIAEVAVVFAGGCDGGKS